MTAWNPFISVPNSTRASESHHEMLWRLVGAPRRAAIFRERCATTRKLSHLPMLYSIKVCPSWFLGIVRLLGRSRKMT
jgi:hypothetical protein